MSRKQVEVPGWKLDPLDPRAPSDEVWDALTPEQRAIVVEALPLNLDSIRDAALERVAELEAALAERDARIEALERRLAALEGR